MTEIIPAAAVLSFALGNNQEAGLFGYKIPYLPDFLTDHTLLGESQVDRLEEVLQRFSRLVAGLRKHHGSAFALRFISRPESGSIDLFLILRVICQ